MCPERILYPLALSVLSMSALLFLATADNVIRAGLTPKLRDTEVLCASLTYGQGLPDVLTGAKSAASPHLAVYRPPFRCAQLAAWRCVASGSSSVSFDRSCHMIYGRQKL